jgi:hypothetical protein
MGNDFNFTFPELGGNKREMYRVVVPGLKLIHRQSGLVCEAANISASGVLLKNPPAGPQLSMGQELIVDLVVGDHVLLDGIQVQVIHVEPGKTGCRLVDLSYRDETVLDKLILDAQKRQIAKRKAEKTEKGSSFDQDKS